MSGIFGIFNRDGSPVEPSRLAAMRDAMDYWGPDGFGLWVDGCAALGQSRFFSFPEARHENLPLIDSENDLVFTAEGRVDNRADLGRQLGILTSRFDKLPDSEFIRQAYLRWGKDCVGCIYGDWSFAVWHPKERRLFLARDHFGITSLYYYAGEEVFAFASSRKALLSLNLAPVEMDELYLGQILVSWFAYHGERTIHKPIRRLPPAHTLTVTSASLDKRIYWRLEDTQPLRLKKREDYVAAFLEVWDEAVRARLRAVGPIACTLSSGLDSGAVTATSAHLSRGENREIHAYTSVPIYNTDGFLGDRYGDEFPNASAAARFAGVEHFPVPARDYSPIQAIRDLLQANDEPGHAPSNGYWMIDLERNARQRGSRVLLTGQMGNMGISWFGSPLSQSFGFQLRKLGLRGLLRESVKLGKSRLKYSLPMLALAWMKLNGMKKTAFSGSAVHPEFARRLHLRELRLADPEDSLAQNPTNMRLSIIKPGRNFVGALHNERGMANGMEVRDPSSDARVLAFTLSVPDEIFIHRDTGQNRWLIRAAMQGRLPDDVLWSKGRAFQGGDIVPRLRAVAGEVEAALNELEQGPAAAYLDVANMRRAWNVARTDNTYQAWISCVSIITRGIMAGLFVNEF